jgi:HSP20 family molecular chaperone IbpA
MVRRFHRSIYDELDELRASMDYLYQLALDPADNPLLPDDDTPGIVCQSVHNLNAEVAEHDDEVTVTVDTIPGDGDLSTSVALIDENTLSITCCRGEKPRNNGRDALHERISFSLNRVIPLPARVMHRGARMSLRNGVLDIHLRKVPAL